MWGRALVQTTVAAGHHQHVRMLLAQSNAVGWLVLLRSADCIHERHIAWAVPAQDFHDTVVGQCAAAVQTRHDLAFELVALPHDLYGDRGARVYVVPKKHLAPWCLYRGISFTKQ